MARVIRFFDKKTESYAGMISLLDIPLKLLHENFNVDEGDPNVYACYPITDKHQKFLKNYMSTKLDFQKFDYFLEFDS